MSPTIAKGDQARCFHGWRECSFCRFPASPVKKAPLRCVACGRKRRRGTAEHCTVCRVRGFVALRLFR